MACASENSSSLGCLLKACFSLIRLIRAVHNLISFWLYLLFQSLLCWPVQQRFTTSFMGSPLGLCCAPHCASSPLLWYGVPSGNAWPSCTYNPTPCRRLCLTGQSLADGQQELLEQCFLSSSLVDKMSILYGPMRSSTQSHRAVANSAMHPYVGSFLFPIFSFVSHLFLLR